MELNQFVQDFAGCFEETPASEFTPQTSFKELEEWDSLSALAIIGVCSKKYGVQVKGAEIREANTIEDVYNLVLVRK